MDTQNAALSKIVLDGELLPFIESRISLEFFPDPGHGRIWTMVLEHYKKYGKPPAPEVVHAAYPTYKFQDYPEPTRFYLHQLQQDRKKVLLTHAVQAYASRIANQEEGPDIGNELELILRDGLARAAHEISQGKDTDFFLSYDRLLEKLHDRRINGHLLRGISTGFHGLDHLTGGLQGEQLVTVVGVSKAGKSSMLLKMAYNAHRNGSPPLFVTFEMSTGELEDRLVSLMTGIGLTKILSGDFTAEEEQQIQEALKLRKDMAGFTITSDTASAITVSGVQAKIQQYNPAFVIIDGVYMMDDESGHDTGSPQALTSITRSFKRLAQTLDLPIVLSTQAMLYRSKKGLKLDSIGYTSSFAQDSDIVLGVEPDEYLVGVSKFHILASRSSPKGSAFVRFDWSQGLIEEIPFALYEKMVANSPKGAGGAPAKAATGMQAHWDKQNVVA